jgi:hypothetical protein
MVRRMAAENFQNLASQLSIHEIQEEFLSPFNKLASDDQDSVRIQAINICISFAQSLPVEFKVSNVLCCCFYVMWRGVLFCCDFFVCSDVIFCGLQTSQVLPVVIAIGCDRAWRVRWSLACNIFAVSQALGDQMINNTVFECFDNLLRDSEAEVKSPQLCLLSMKWT